MKRPAAAESKPKPKLTYLDFAGFGEPIRLTLFIGNIDFEDERISREEVKKRRADGQLPVGQVPVLDIGDSHGPYGQSNAILRWAGKEAGLYPQELQFRCDMILETILDVAYKLNTWWYGAACGRDPRSGEVVIPLTAEQNNQVAPFLNDVLLPARMADMERIVVKSGGPYFCGSDLTICDISFYSFALPLQKGSMTTGQAGGSLTAACLKQCPMLCKLIETVAKHPKVIEWHAAHPE
eukprot:TRINITY_DN90569_c0_g1_i1.p1 TRINITY_DN90569_c0_g1~~TRINITY_DN90569_c0_g1_i1.p1  ORF type:complete len:238 (+),score=45.16 TRINITY_DN90569_c0_g1_i1:108-821(+)